MGSGWRCAALPEAGRVPPPPPAHSPPTSPTQLKSEDYSPGNHSLYLDLTRKWAARLAVSAAGGVYDDSFEPAAGEALPSAPAPAPAPVSASAASAGDAGAGVGGSAPAAAPGQGQGQEGGLEDGSGLPSAAARLEAAEGDVVLEGVERDDTPHSGGGAPSSAEL